MVIRSFLCFLRSRFIFQTCGCFNGALKITAKLNNLILSSYFASQKYFYREIQPSSGFVAYLLSRVGFPGRRQKGLGDRTGLSATNRYVHFVVPKEDNSRHTSISAAT